jgi:hypothetical protein
MGGTAILDFQYVRSYAKKNYPRQKVFYPRRKQNGFFQGMHLIAILSI